MELDNNVVQEKSKEEKNYQKKREDGMEEERKMKMNLGRKKNEERTKRKMKHWRERK